MLIKKEKNGRGEMKYVYLTPSIILCKRKLGFKRLELFYYL